MYINAINTIAVGCVQLDFTDGGAGVGIIERFVRLCQTLWIICNS